MKFRRKKIVRIQPLRERLKRARRRKRLSLEEVENLTKIRVRYIESLEKGLYSNLPSDVYVRGFLHTLSSLYKIDARNIIQQYQKEKEVIGIPKPKKLTPALREIKNPFLITPKLLLLILGIIIVLGIGGYLSWQVSGFAAAPKLEIIQPPEENLTLESDTLTIEGRADPGAEVKINDQLIALDLDGNFKKQIKLKEGLNSIKIVAKNRIGKQSQKQINALAKIGEITAPTIAKITGLKLVIQVGPGSSWVSVDLDGKNVYKGVMLAKTSQEFTAEKEIILSTGNAGSTRVFLNDKDLGLLGAEGEKKDTKYTPENIK